MKLFLVLLTLISSYILISKESFAISLTLLFLVILVSAKKYKNDKNFFILLAIIFLAGLIYKNIPRYTFQSEENLVGIVIKRKDNYFILFDGIESFYVSSDDSSIGLFDIITVNGSINNLDFKKPLESEFDFKNYLISSGINRKIDINSYTTNLEFVINVVQYKSSIISLFSDEQCRVFVSSFLFNELDYTDELVLKIKNAGLINLISLSGVYISALFSFFNKIFSKFLKEKWAKLLTIIFFLPLLLLNINKITFLRVFVAQIVGLVITFKNVKINTLAKKVVPYLIILLLNPFAVNSYAIIISLIINFGIYFSGLIIKKRKKIYRKFFFYVLLLILSFPLTISFSYTINVLNYAINIALIPIIKVLVILIFPSIYLIKIPFIEYLINFIFIQISKINFSFLNIYLDSFNQFEFIFYYCLLFLFLYFKEINFKQFYQKILLCLTSFFVFECMPLSRTVFYEVDFINIGQGDSTLIRFHDKNILIDTGGSLYKDIASASLIPYFKRNKIYKINTVLITHYDTDHYYALESLKTNFNVGNVYDYTNFNGLKFDNFEMYNINTEILDVVEENSKSLVLYFKIYDSTFLVMGDAPISVEENILSRGINVKADYLKVGHHGSKTSSSYDFVKKVAPKEAIISCGENNRYGHPHEETLETLDKLGVKVRRTDEEGTITYKFSCFL